MTRTQVTGHKSQGVFFTKSARLPANAFMAGRSLACYGLAVLLFSSPVTAHACAVCFGNKDSLQTKGAMAGVLFLLAVILGVLVSLAITFIRWGARERALQAQYGPPSSEPGHS